MLAPRIAALERAVAENRAALTALRVFFISSTERGGGVAEMLPRIMLLMRALDVGAVQWGIIDDEDEARQARFFKLTRVLHTNLHGEGEASALRAGDL